MKALAEVFFYALCSIDVSCRIDYEEIIKSYFCKQMCNTDGILKIISDES